MKTGIYKLPSNFGGGLNYLSQDFLRPNESPGPVWNYAPFILSKTGRLEAELHGGIETLNKFPGTMRASGFIRHGSYNFPHYFEGFDAYRHPEDLEHPEGGLRNQALILIAPWDDQQHRVAWPQLWHLEVKNGEISKPENYPAPYRFYEEHLYWDTRGADYHFPHGLTYNIVDYKNIAVILPSHEMMWGYYGLWKTNVAWNAKKILPTGAMGWEAPIISRRSGGTLYPDQYYYYFLVWVDQYREEGGPPINLRFHHSGVPGHIPRQLTTSTQKTLDIGFSNITAPEWAEGAFIYRAGPFGTQRKDNMTNVPWVRVPKDQPEGFRRKDGAPMFTGSYWRDIGHSMDHLWESAPPVICRNAPVARCGASWQNSLWLAGFPESPFIDYPPKPDPWDGDVFHPFWLVYSRPGTFNFADYNFGWNYIDLGTAGGDIVGIVATETQLLVFRTHQIHRIRVYGNSYENRIISTDKGVWNQQAIATDGENVYFYDYLGNTIWGYNGVNFQDVGVKIAPYLQREQSGRFGGQIDGVRSVQQNYRLYFFDGRLYVSRFSMGANLNPSDYDTHIGEFRGSDVVWTRVPWGAMFFADTGSFGEDGLMGDITEQGKPALLIAGKLNDSDPLLLRHNDVTKYEDTYTGETLELLWGSKWSDFDLPGYIKRIATIRFNVEHYRGDGGDSLLQIEIYKNHEGTRIWADTVTIEQGLLEDQYKYEVPVPDTVRGENFQIRFSETAIEEPDDFLRIKAPVLVEYYYNDQQFS